MKLPKQQGIANKDLAFHSSRSTGLLWSNQFAFKIRWEKSQSDSSIINLINLLLSPTTDAQNKKILYFQVP